MRRVTKGNVVILIPESDEDRAELERLAEREDIDDGMETRLHPGSPPAPHATGAQLP